MMNTGRGGAGVAENSATSVTTNKHKDNPEKPTNQPLRDEGGLFEEGTTPGPGRSPKYTSEPPTEPPGQQVRPQAS